MEGQLRRFYKIWKTVAEKHFAGKKVDLKKLCKGLILVAALLSTVVLAVVVIFVDGLLLRSNNTTEYFISIVITAIYSTFASACIRWLKEKSIDYSQAPYQAEYYEELLTAFGDEFVKRGIDINLGLGDLIDALGKSIEEVENSGKDMRNIVLAILNVTILSLTVALCRQAVELVEIDLRIQWTLTLSLNVAFLAIVVAFIIDGAAMSFASLRSQISLPDMRLLKGDSEYVALLKESRVPPVVGKHLGR